MSSSGQHFCLNLSNSHIVQYWSKWSEASIVTELLSFERCPTETREYVLKGERMSSHNNNNNNNNNFTFFRSYPKIESIVRPAEKTRRRRTFPVPSSAFCLSATFRISKQNDERSDQWKCRRRKQSQGRQCTTRGRAKEDGKAADDRTGA